jgi:excisionase family DNA binding protein
MKTTDQEHAMQDNGSGTKPADLASLLLEPSKPSKPKHASPYMLAEQAADYLQVTVKALYGLVERRKLRPLPGHRRYRFTAQQLDSYLRGELPR